MVQLKNVSHGRKIPVYKLVTARATQLPHGIVINGILERPETVRKYISHLLSKTGQGEKAIKSPWVVASLPDNHGFIKLIQIEKDPEDVIEEDIIIASKKHIPFQEDDYYLDWQIVPNISHNPNETNILLSSVSKKVADMYTYLFESLGLAVVALELGALSTARSMITADKDYTGQARAMLDIGATRSTITVFDHGHIQFSSSLPYSGEVLTAAIAQELHLSYDESEMKKKTFGLEYSKSKSWPVLTDLTDQLADQINKAFDFYYSHFPNTNQITHITMCGGGSVLKNLDNIISLKLKIDAKPGNVWKNLHSKKPILFDTTKSMRFTKAIGLALRAADNPFFRTEAV